MPFAVSECAFDGPTTLISDYDSSKISMGTLMTQKTDYNGQKHVGPGYTSNRIFDFIGYYCYALDVIEIDENTDGIFTIQGITTGNAKNIVFFTFNRSKCEFTFKGHVQINFPQAGNYTIRDFNVIRYLYTTGTVSTSGSTVTGTGTQWVTDRLASGARIGFGSTDPAQITTWHKIHSINGEDALTLKTDAGTIADGPYVIDEIRFLICTTHATPANGGVFLMKGFNFDEISCTSFLNGITDSNDERSLYRFTDGDENTITEAYGVAVDEMTDWQTHYAYVGNGTSSLRYYKLNLRAALSNLEGGSTSSAYMYKTASIGLPVSGVTAVNHKIYTINHGPNPGSKNLFFAYNVNIGRVDIDKIQPGSADFMLDNILEQPMGGIVNYVRSSSTQNITSLAYSNYMDRFYIIGQWKAYIFKYDTNTQNFENALFFFSTRANGSLSVKNNPAFISSTAGLSFYAKWSNSGYLFLINLSGNYNNLLYALPVAADTFYAKEFNQVIITPKIKTQNNLSFNKVYTNPVLWIGNEFGEKTEGFKTFARTAGIDDNSGEWTLLDSTGDLSKFDPSEYIQFKYEFYLIPRGCNLPARLISCVVSYLDFSPDEHFMMSVEKSDPQARTFTWWYAQEFSSVPELGIYFINSVSGELLYSDTTLTPQGNFEYSSNGSDWVEWDGQNKVNNNCYVRYSTTQKFGKRLTPVLKAIS